MRLLVAIDRFDLVNQTRLATYAIWWIRQAIQRAVAGGAYPVRLNPQAAPPTGPDATDRRRSRPGPADALRPAAAGAVADDRTRVRGHPPRDLARCPQPLRRHDRRSSSSSSRRTMKILRPTTNPVVGRRPDQHLGLPGTAHPQAPLWAGGRAASDAHPGQPRPRRLERTGSSDPGSSPGTASNLADGGDRVSIKSQPCPPHRSWPRKGARWNRGEKVG